MQAILKEFKPLIKNNIHDEYNGYYKFIVSLESIEHNSKIIEGEAMAKSQAGSKYWIVGSLHDFEKKDNDYATGGNQIKGLKVVETKVNTDPGNSNNKNIIPFDIMKESFVISRFSHTIALEYINSLPIEESAKLREDKGAKLISLFAKSFARSVYEVANEVLKLHEEGN